MVLTQRANSKALPTLPPVPDGAEDEAAAATAPGAPPKGGRQGGGSGAGVPHRHSSLFRGGGGGGSLPLGRYVLLVVVAFAAVSALWLAPAVSARGLKNYITCASPPCLPTTAEAAATAGSTLELPPAQTQPPGSRPLATTRSGPASPGIGSGPTAILSEYMPASPAPAPAPAPAPVQAFAAAAAAAAPAVPYTPTVVGSGGINVISSNPISISNPITIKNPNVNHELNKVGSLVAGGGPGGAGGKAALLQGVAGLINGIGAVGGALLGGRRRAG
ncbi:hypothetical protein HXX76_013877 [Chlamydomonas incerta]|uniref:Uncharacterized protein n=1 Tax=Chlamydomonas incerta TaxID=51695 RepID=A0A835SGV1_CHLIN|nr:hypothetical protein HXX76_013877 [Chlamydomonas incerta]|eukprot:KAG2425296.1 hypothetical protein HXX76_013877 [Chlamydomonas incerta]